MIEEGSRAEQRLDGFRSMTGVLVVHVQRTAGTSLRRALEAGHGPDVVYPPAAVLDARPEGRYESAAELLSRWDALPPHRFLFGHYLAALVDVLPARYRTATFLREPVARSVSIVEHHAAQTGRAASELLTDERFLASHISDLQTRVFGSEISVVDGKPCIKRPQEAAAADDATLTRAVARLESFDFVGLTEEFGSSVARFDEVFGTCVSQTIGWVNHSRPSDVPRAEITSVVSPLVRRDQELFQHVSRRCRQASSTPGVGQ